MKRLVRIKRTRVKFRNYHEFPRAIHTHRYFSHKYTTKFLLILQTCPLKFVISDNQPWIIVPCPQSQGYPTTRQHEPVWSLCIPVIAYHQKCDILMNHITSDAMQAGVILTGTLIVYKVNIDWKWKSVYVDIDMAKVVVIFSLMVLISSFVEGRGEIFLHWTNIL